MKTVLCYGDSNTWGADPATGGRYARDVRWTGVLRNTLGEEYLIIEEGLNGRTTVWDDPIEGYKNGMSYLIPCLETHRPIDLVIIMLGTNDLKMRFSVSAYDIGQSMAVLIDIVKKSKAGIDDNAPKLLVMAPPPTTTLSDYAEMFDGAYEKSVKLADRYHAVTQEYGCHFLRTSDYIRSSELDGIHLDASEHAKLGEAVAQKVKSILG